MSSELPWNRLPPGQEWEGWLPGDPQVPVLARRGPRDGPTVLLTGGVHGDEYEGPAAILECLRQIEARGGLAAGRLLAVTVANPTAWAARARTTPADSGDLNRHFPGRNPQSPTGQLAERIFDALVRDCDVLIDLHSGGVRMIHLPLVGWYRTGDPQAEALARAFHSDLHPWLIPDAPGVLSYEAARIGKVAFGTEWRGGAALDPSGVKALAEGLVRTLQSLGVCGGHPLPVTRDWRTPIAGDYLECRHSGLFTAGVELGAPVQQGEALGTLRDVFGKTLDRPCAPLSGIVAALPHYGWVLAGERIAYIG